MTVLLKQKVKKSSVAIWTWLFEIPVSSWLPPLSSVLSVSKFFKNFTAAIFVCVRLFASLKFWQHDFRKKLVKNTKTEVLLSLHSLPIACILYFFLSSVFVIRTNFHFWKGQWGSGWWLRSSRDSREEGEVQD